MKISDDENGNDNLNNRANKNKTTASKSFGYKKKITGNMSNNNDILYPEVVVPLKYLSNFWRFLDLPFINCEIGLDLRWTKNCVISEISRIFRAFGDPPEQEVAIATTGATFQINKVKLYVPVATLLINDNIKVLENIKQEFKRTISWKKYRSEIKTQAKSDNLDYLIDTTFRNTNRLLVLSKMVMIILQDILLINISRNQRF